MRRWTDIAGLSPKRAFRPPGALGVSFLQTTPLHQRLSPLEVFRSVFGSVRKIVRGVRNGTTPVRRFPTKSISFLTISAGQMARRRSPLSIESLVRSWRTGLRWRRAVRFGGLAGSFLCRGRCMVVVPVMVPRPAPWWRQPKPGKIPVPIVPVPMMMVMPRGQFEIVRSSRPSQLARRCRHHRGDRLCRNLHCKGRCNCSGDDGPVQHTTSRVPLSRYELCHNSDAGNSTHAALTWVRPDARGVKTKRGGGL